MVLPCEFRYFWIWGNSEKGCIETEDWGFSVHLVFGLQGNFIYLRCYKMVQSLYKNWLLLSKITWGTWTTSKKSKKLKLS